MKRAKSYVWLLSAVVWLVPALVLAQNTPGPKVRAQSPGAAAQGVDAAKAAQIRTQIHQKLADLAKAKAAEQQDQVQIQQLTEELQTLRAQLRQGSATGAAVQPGQCLIGGPGLGLGLGRGPGFAGGAANQTAAGAPVVKLDVLGRQAAAVRAGRAWDLAVERAGIARMRRARLRRMWPHRPVEAAARVVDEATGEAAETFFDGLRRVSR